MADAMDTLKSILGDGAEDKIKSVMDTLGSGGIQGGGTENGESGEYIDQMRSLMSRLALSRDDPRTNLLLSLKPYMRAGRQRSIDSAVRLLNMTKLARLFRQ